MKRFLICFIIAVSPVLAFAADMKSKPDTADRGKDNTATLPKHRPQGNPPTQADIDSLPKTSVVSENNHEAPPEQGTTVEQPK